MPKFDYLLDFYQLLLVVSLPYTLQGLLCVQCDRKEKNGSITNLCLEGVMPPSPCLSHNHLCITDYYRSYIISDDRQKEPFIEEKVTWRKCGLESEVGCKIYQLKPPENHEKDKGRSFHSFVVSPANEIELRPGEVQVCSIGCSWDGCLMKGASQTKSVSTSIYTFSMCTTTLLTILNWIM